MKREASALQLSFSARVGLFVTGIVMLLAVYIFQRLNVVASWPEVHPNLAFAINRVCRLILNDAACLLIILSVFREKKYMELAFWVFLVELLIILPLYLAVKLSMEGDSEISSPFLSQVHRLVVNPMLMILLIAGFVYQRHIKKYK